MLDNLKLSYENMGSSSFLTISFPPGSNLIEYQLGMITGNQIKNLLPASKRRFNDETLIYYDISSRITLGQILSRRQLSKKELVHFLDSTVAALEDVEEYQLSGDAILMDPDLIFVDPSTCSPGFVYLPQNSVQDKQICDLILQIIMNNGLEASDDNTVQVLLGVCKKESFSVLKLKEALNQIRAREKDKMTTGSEGRSYTPGIPPQETSRSVGNQYQNMTGMISTPQTGFQQPQQGYEQRGMYSFPQDQRQMEEDRYRRSIGNPSGYYGGTVAGPNITDEEEVPSIDQNRKGKSKKADKKAEKRKLKNAKAEKKGQKGGDVTDIDEFDYDAAKKKFILPQAAVAILVCAMISFGFFFDSNGQFVLNNLLAVLIVLGMFEVILYREVYVNSRSKKGKKKTEAKQKTLTDGKQKREIPRKRIGIKDSGIPSMPDSFAGRTGNPTGLPKEELIIPSDAVRPAPLNAYNMMPIHESAAEGSPYTDNSLPTGTSGRQGSAYQPYVLTPSSMEDDNEGTLLDETGGSQAYLEYYENGNMTRVPLDKPSVLVGRLRSQVDFAVTSPRVGKIHAEFLNNNGQFYVKDLNSKNGTYLNGGQQRIVSNVLTPLKDNDRIRLADIEFTLRCPAQ